MWITVFLVDPSSKQQNTRFQNSRCCVRKFCFSARKRRLWKWFILLNRTLSLLSQWDFVNEEFVYSVTACKQEYLTKYRDLMIQETSLKAHTISWRFETTWAELNNWTTGPRYWRKDVIEHFWNSKESEHVLWTEWSTFSTLVWCLTAINLFLLIVSWSV